MKLSIVIPTRQRIQYLRQSVKTALEIESDNVEIIVSDNASTDATFDEMSQIKDPRFKYVNTGRSVSMRANFENGLAHSTGDYVIFFGDDDGILPRQIPMLLTLLERERPDVLKWPLVRYGWPRDGDHKTGGIRLKKSSVYGPLKRIDAPKLLNETLNCDFNSNEEHPAIYHGAVSRQYIDRLRTPDGQFFNCTIPDIYFGYLSLFKGGNLLYCSHPFSLNGHSPASNGGSQKQLGVKGKVPDIAARFAKDNEADANLDVARFGASIAATFFLSLETARVVAEVPSSRVNYRSWFEFIANHTRGISSEMRTEIYRKLEAYARDIGQDTALIESFDNPRTSAKQLDKLKRKIGENLVKFNSVRFSCAQGGENTILTAAHVCDAILASDFNADPERQNNQNTAWGALKGRYRAM